MPSRDKLPAHTRLLDNRTLLHDEGACLPLRSRHGQCRACAVACPVGALTVSVEAVELAESCIGCGRCTAACPTQALALPELAMLADPVPAVARSAMLRVECRKVPADRLATGTLVVPCLGALTAGHLLARQAAGIVVQIVDRGWCAGCEAGCTEAHPDHPAQAALDAAVLWLDAIGERRRPSIVREALPLDQRPSAMAPAAEETPRVDRRSFFREALQRPTGRQRPAAVPMGGSGRAAYPANQRRPSPERERQLAAAAVLAQAHETAMPAEMYPQLHVDGRCCDRRLCVALCPTAALSVADDGLAVHLQWSSERCIGCGTCVRGCPEVAIHLQAHGGRPGVQVLATHRRACCPSCGDAFTPAPGQEEPDPSALCPTCTKSRRFMNDARRQLFGELN